MLGRFNDHLMSARTVHAVENAFRLPVEPAFDFQRRILIRHHAHLPSRAIFLSACVRAISHDLRRRLVLMPWTKRAMRRLESYWFTDKLLRPFRALSRNDDPPSGDGVFS